MQPPMASSESGSSRRATGSSGDFPRGRDFARLTLVAALLGASPAHALWGDRIEVFAGHNVTYDSNVFRISDDRDPQATIGAPDFSDTSRTTLVGFTADIPVS